MMDPAISQFAAENHKAVLTTFRSDGAAQMSVILVAPLGDGVACTTPDDRAKLGNLRRNPRCSLLISKDDWWGYVVLEGRAQIDTVETLGAEKFRAASREVYRQISGEHPNWDEYDQAMIDERRAVVTVVPDRIYGTAV